MNALTTSRAVACVDVWTWSLDQPAIVTDLLSASLSADERRRADRYAHPIHRARWVAARSGMRHILGDAIGKLPREIVFSAEPHGRPFIVANDNPDLSFNLSHAGGVAALAISFDARVGTDIEELRPINADEMAFATSSSEGEALFKLTDQERLEEFFRFWTLKESFIKAVGTGVSLPLQDFDMSPSNAGEPRLLRLAGRQDEPTRWRFASERPVPGYVAAVGALTEGRDLKVRWRAV